MVLVRANPYLKLKKDNHCSLSNNCWKIESWRILMWSTFHQGMMPYWGFRVSLCFWQLEQLAAAATGSVLVRSPTLQPAHGFPLGSAICMILTKPWDGYGQRLTASHWTSQTVFLVGEYHRCSLVGIIMKCRDRYAFLRGSSVVAVHFQLAATYTANPFLVIWVFLLCWLVTENLHPTCEATDVRWEREEVVQQK